MKRGQVTVFIIIAVVLIVVAGVIIFMNQRQAQMSKEYFESVEIKPQVDNIQTSILDCIKVSSKDALDTIGIQGGYYEPPANVYYDLEWAFVPYYYYEGQDLMPSKESIEDELGKYMEDHVEGCINELSFENFELDYDQAEATVFIKSGEVEFNVNMPIKIKREGKRITFETIKFPISQDSSLDDMIGVAEYLTESHLEDAAVYCISCLGDMALERNLYIDMVEFDDLSTLIIVSENQTSSEPYSFEFLYKYTGEEISPIPDDPDATDFPPVPEADV